MSPYDLTVLVLFVASVVWAILGLVNWRRGGSKGAYPGTLFTVLLGNLLLKDVVAESTRSLLFVPALVLLVLWLLYERRKSRRGGSAQRSPRPA